ncbi:glycosyltransferase [Nocardioides convexus]|uniref:glycosyltransferase n=1 Tax=Nocardioides convexus TaxID=2712224 RepID=UPI0024189913|nr:glycosyltransferase [Nocardioides convexus]
MEDLSGGTSMRGLQRAVGLLIIGTAALGAALLWWAVSDTRSGQAAPSDGIVFGVWHLLYDTEAPTLPTLAFAAGLALLFAAGVAVLERRIANRARRSEDGAGLPLSPKHVMTETRGVFHGPVTLTVLVPAHNEEAAIRGTLESLLAQSHPPERIIVVADNCTDDTPAIARSMGVEVFETVDNKHKKAGGLNQCLKDVLPGQGENDLVMVMDADTSLDDGFLEAVVRRMSADRALMAVGGLFYGEEGKGLIGQFQRNEYTRYGRDLRRRRGRVFVLTGTATAFRPRALRAVAAERGKILPGIPGDVYDTLVLTEDNEITLALKTLGGLIISPSDCTVVTEVMPTWRALWAQRLRWQRGALENLGEYGMRPATFRYWAQRTRHRLRRDRAVRLPAADVLDDDLLRPVGVVPVLGRHRPDLHRRADHHRVARGLEGPPARRHPLPGAWPTRSSSTSSTSRGSSTCPSGARPPGSTSSRPRAATGWRHDRDEQPAGSARHPLPRGPRPLARVRDPRGLRGDQHRRVRRAVDRQGPAQDLPHRPPPPALPARRDPQHLPRRAALRRRTGTAEPPAHEGRGARCGEAPENRPRYFFTAAESLLDQVGHAAGPLEGSERSAGRRRRSSRDRRPGRRGRP